MELKEAKDDPDQEAVQKANDGKLLVIHRALHIVISPKVDEQRDNIFQTHYTINRKVCMMIIDGGSCTNITSITLIDKLKLPTSKHPQLYKLQWLSKGIDLKVTKQAVVSFLIGKNYQD